jgi:hypothetical protein
MEFSPGTFTHAMPEQRPLRIFASDPMRANEPGSRITINVLNETLKPGPQGSRFEVIDYDGVRDCFYRPVNLDDPAILMRGGLEPIESDPMFHQQMVYAVAMRTLENFEQALGRRLEFRRPPYRKLRLFPHAFYGANAFYDRELNAISFGYFRADRKNPGRNLPGQLVFTCLSHDIIAHEMTHAIVDRLRRHFLEPSNIDVLAFHEGFADIIALLQHFSFREFLRDQIQKTRGNIRQGELLMDLARQFGYATGASHALRSAVGSSEMRLSDNVIEAHERGSILVAAVFDAFFAVYQNRIQDLIRIASEGRGILPEGELHPNLVNRMANEAAKTAQAILTMCIRAFDYLPPVDITFGEFLRALVTADFKLYPCDEIRLRASLIEAFRARGIYPESTVSLAEESLVWQDAPKDIPPLPGIAGEIAHASIAFSHDPKYSPEVKNWGAFSTSDEWKKNRNLWKSLHKYASDNAARLGLVPDRKIRVRGFHPSFRVGMMGRLITEAIVQFTQEDKDENRLNQLGGIPFRGGTTIIATTDGRVQHVISKPLLSKRMEESAQKGAAARLERQRDYLDKMGRTDPFMAYGDENYLRQRAKFKMNFASLHQGGLQDESSKKRIKI